MPAAKKCSVKATRSGLIKLKIRSLLSCIAALLCYGGWAFYANQDYGFNVASKAALTQGSYSFILTLLLSGVMEYFYRIWRRQKWRYPITVGATCLTLYATSWGVNALLGTPEILVTIFPGAVIGTVYTVCYCMVLSKAFAGNHPLTDTVQKIRTT